MNKMYKYLLRYTWYKRYVLRCLWRMLLHHDAKHNTIGLCSAWMCAKEVNHGLPNCNVEGLLWDIPQLHVAITKHPLYHKENYEAYRGYWFHESSLWDQHEYCHKFNKIRIDVVMNALILLKDPTWLDKTKSSPDVKKAILPKLKDE